MLCRAVPCRAVPCRAVPCRAVCPQEYLDGVNVAKVKKQQVGASFVASRFILRSGSSPRCLRWSLQLKPLPVHSFGWLIEKGGR